MGQAKNRGSHAERVEQAAKRRTDENAKLGLAADALDVASHFGFIMDRCEKGREVMAALKAKFPDLAPKTEIYDGMAWEFFIYIKSSKFDGQFTVMAKDEEMLLKEALPAAVKKILEVGGYCAFSLAVKPVLVPQLQELIAQLQPTVDSGAAH